MLRAATILAVIAAPSVATAEPRWTQADTALEVAVLATLGADLLQTSEIVNGNRHLESNPIIRAGAPPALYFGAIAAAHVLATRAIPQPYRAILQVATIAVEGRCIGINWSAGYELHF